MGKWRISAALSCDKGRIRKNNEDAFFFNGQWMPVNRMDDGAEMRMEGSASGSLWAVCDGMGGQSNGEIASYTAVSGMEDLKNHLKGRSFEETVQSWVRQANRAVMEQAGDGGTTLAMLYCSDNNLQVAHVGDSRVYRYHAGKLTQLTRDHSKVEMLYAAGIITREQMRIHPQKNVVTRYLGMSDEYVCEATLSRRIPLMHDDRYLLCSDGVTDMLTDEEIAEILQRTEGVEETTKALKEKALAAGGRDNLTLIVLKLESEDGNKILPEEEEFVLDENTEEDEPTIVDENKGKETVNINVSIHRGLIKGCEVALTNCARNICVRVNGVPA